MPPEPAGLLSAGSILVTPRSMGDSPNNHRLPPMARKLALCAVTFNTFHVRLPFGFCMYLVGAPFGGLWVDPRGSKQTRAL